MRKSKILKSIIIIVSVMMINVYVVAQNVGIGANTFTPDNSALLELQSTNSGLLIPRVPLTSATDATTISSPATSLMVYNTNTNGTAPNNVYPGYYYNQGTTTAPKWVRLETNTDNGGGGPTGCASCISMVSDVSTESMTWGACANTCRNMTNDGFNDWRMPTFDEVIYYVSGASNISFTASSSYIWTSTPWDVRVTNSIAYGNWVIFKESAGYWDNHNYSHNNNYHGDSYIYCRCVR